MTAILEETAAQRFVIDMDEVTGNRSSTRLCGDDSGACERAVSNQLVQFFPRAWRVARRMGLGPAQAEEAAQEAFVVFLQKRAQIDDGKELAFLLSTVANISQNLRRRSHVRRELLCAPEQLDHHVAEATTTCSLEQEADKALVDDILLRLSESLRVVFVLYELEELTLQEIAETLHVPLGTVGSRLRLARHAFRKELNRRIKIGLISPEEL